MCLLESRAPAQDAHVTTDCGAVNNLSLRVSDQSFTGSADQAVGFAVLGVRGLGFKS